MLDFREDAGCLSFLMGGSLVLVVGCFGVFW